MPSRIVLYAGQKRGMVFALQGMDASGKDGLVYHVMTGLNPQGCTVTSFKRPTEAELAEHYLARHERALPDKGVVAVWNRSHYEEVGIVRVRPRILGARGINPSGIGEDERGRGDRKGCQTLESPEFNSGN